MNAHQLCRHPLQHTPGSVNPLSIRAIASFLNSENPVKKLILILSMVLAGCAAEVLSVTDQLIVVKARERNRPEAQDLAEAKCQQRGLHARLTQRLAENQLGFECVR